MRDKFGADFCTFISHQAVQFSSVDGLHLTSHASEILSNCVHRLSGL